MSTHFAKSPGMASSAHHYKDLRIALPQSHLLSP